MLQAWHNRKNAAVFPRHPDSGRERQPARPYRLIQARIVAQPLHGLCHRRHRPAVHQQAVSPSRTASVLPPSRPAITGRPQLLASRNTSPNPSVSPFAQLAVRHDEHVAEPVMVDQFVVRHLARENDLVANPAVRPRNASSATRYGPVADDQIAACRDASARTERRRRAMRGRCLFSPAGGTPRRTRSSRPARRARPGRRAPRRAKAGRRRPRSRSA